MSSYLGTSALPQTAVASEPERKHGTAFDAFVFQFTAVKPLGVALAAVFLHPGCLIMSCPVGEGRRSALSVTAIVAPWPTLQHRAHPYDTSLGIHPSPSEPKALIHGVTRIE